MFSRPHIIVATDFSESSDHAMRAAEKLRHASDGKIYAIHVTPYQDQWDWLTNDVVINYTSADYKKDYMAFLNNKLSAQINTCGVKGEGEILLGPVVPTLLKYLSEIKPDLIVLGRKIRLGPLHLGGVASKIMAGANIPVLIASDDLDVERLAGLVDPNYAEKKLFSVTEELAFLCSGQVEFVSVCPENGIVIEQSLPEKPQVLRLTEEKKKEIKDRMDLTLKRNADPHTSAHFRTEIAPHGSVDELVKILTEDDIHLAVMTKHHKGILEKFFLGSVTKGIFDHWKGNLLVLPS